MAEAKVVARLERTAELLAWESEFLTRVSNQVRDVRSKLQKLPSFLKDADRKRGKEDVLSLKMEDVLETYAVEVESRRELGQFNQFLTRCCDVFCECITLHKLDPQIKSIQKTLTRLQAETMESLDLEESGERSNEEQLLKKLSELKLSEPDFVPRNNEIERQVPLHLKNKNRVRQVLSIWGMGGQGKTTVARKVYEDVKNSHFEASAWVCLTPNLEPSKVLQDILKQLLVQDPKPQDLIPMEIDQLRHKLHQVLTENNCLVMLDDIWSKQHWKDLERAFPHKDEDSGTKILLTTRKQEVPNLGFVYKLERLSSDQGWDLLSKKAFPTTYSHDYDPYAGDRVDPEKEKIGREIVEKCQGLPLAISVVGGVLRMRRELIDWKSVSRDISSILISDKNVDEYGRVRQILARSYDDLTFRYRQLFLYLGNYDEDQEIETLDLYQRWIAEGMVSSDGEQVKRENFDGFADSYLSELAERSLVHVTLAPHGAWIKFQSCRLHDLIRDLCLIKRKEEDTLNLTAIRDIHSEPFDFQAVVRELSALIKICV